MPDGTPRHLSAAMGQVQRKASGAGNKPGGELPKSAPIKVRKAGRVAVDEWNRVTKPEVWGHALGRAELSALEDYCCDVAKAASLQKAVEGETGTWDHLTSAQQIALLGQYRTRVRTYQKEITSFVRVFAYNLGAKPAGVAPKPPASAGERAPTNGAPAWEAGRVT